MPESASLRNPSPFTLIKSYSSKEQAQVSELHWWSKYSTLYFISRFWKKVVETKHRMEEGGAGRAKSKPQESQERKKY